MDMEKEARLTKKLKLLTNTQESILTLSRWIVDRKLDPKTVAQHWLDAIQNAQITQRLHLFYLANDVLQSSRKKMSTKYTDAFQLVLTQATLLSKDAQIKNQIERLFTIWKQRNIYKEDILKPLVDVLNTSDSPVALPPATEQEPEQELIEGVSPTEYNKILSEFKTSHLFEALKELRELQEKKKAQSKLLSHLDIVNNPRASFKHLKGEKAAFKKLDSKLSEAAKMVDSTIDIERRLSTCLAKVNHLLKHCMVYHNTQAKEAQYIAKVYKKFNNNLKSVEKKITKMKEENDFPSLPLANLLLNSNQNAFHQQSLGTPNVSSPSSNVSKDGLPVLLTPRSDSSVLLSNQTAFSPAPQPNKGQSVTSTTSSSEQNSLLPPPQPNESQSSDQNSFSQINDMLYADVQASPATPTGYVSYGAKNSFNYYTPPISSYDTLQAAPEVTLTSSASPDTSQKPTEENDDMDLESDEETGGVIEVFPQTPNVENSSSLYLGNDSLKDFPFNLTDVPNIINLEEIVKTINELPKLNNGNSVTPGMPSGNRVLLPTPGMDVANSTSNEGVNVKALSPPPIPLMTPLQSTPTYSESHNNISGFSEQQQAMSPWGQNSSNSFPLQNQYSQASSDNNSMQNLDLPSKISSYSSIAASPHDYGIPEYSTGNAASNTFAPSRSDEFGQKNEVDDNYEMYPPRRGASGNYMSPQYISEDFPRKDDVSSYSTNRNDSQDYNNDSSFVENDYTPQDNSGNNFSSFERDNHQYNNNSNNYVSSQGYQTNYDSYPANPSEEVNSPRYQNNSPTPNNNRTNSFSLLPTPTPHFDSQHDQHSYPLSKGPHCQENREPFQSYASPGLNHQRPYPNGSDYRQPSYPSNNRTNRLYNQTTRPPRFPGSRAGQNNFRPFRPNNYQRFRNEPY